MNYRVIELKGTNSKHIPFKQQKTTPFKMYTSEKHKTNTPLEMSPTQD